MTGTALPCRRHMKEDISQVRNTQVMSDERHRRTTLTLTEVVIIFTISPWFTRMVDPTRVKQHHPWFMMMMDPSGVITISPWLTRMVDLSVVITIQPLFHDNCGYIRGDNNITPGSR